MCQRTWTSFSGALALTVFGTSACLDWDRLSPPTAGTGGTGAGAGGTSGAAGATTPGLVAWTFADSVAGRTDFVVPDVAAALPDVPLRAAGSSQAQRLASGALLLSSGALRADQAAASALGAAIAATGAASVELWVSSLGTLANSDRVAILTFDPIGVRVFRTPTGLKITVASTGMEADIAVTLANGEARHQVLITYRPDTAVVYSWLDGNPGEAENLSTSGQPNPRLGGDGAQTNVDVGTNGEVSGRLEAVTIFGESLDEAAIKERFAAGPR